MVECGLAITIASEAHVRVPRIAGQEFAQDAARDGGASSIVLEVKPCRAFAFVVGENALILLKKRQAIGNRRDPEVNIARPQLAIVGWRFPELLQRPHPVVISSRGRCCSTTGHEVRRDPTSTRRPAS